MAAIPGSVPVTGFIAPTDDTDTYPATDPIWGIGGWREVADNTARDAIPAARRREGMVVHSIGASQAYRLEGGITNGDWAAFPSGGGGSGAFTDQGSNQILTSTANGNSIDATYGDNSAIIGGANNTVNTPNTIVGGYNVDAAEYISIASYTSGHVAFGENINFNPYDFDGSKRPMIAIGSDIVANYNGSFDPSYGGAMIGHDINLQNCFRVLAIGYGIYQSNINDFVVIGASNGVVMEGIPASGAGLPTGGVYRSGNSLQIKT